MNCVNIKSQEFQELLETTKLPSLLLEMRIAKWQEQNGLDRFPTSDEVLVRSGVKELFESNPELANTVYDTLGFVQEVSLPTSSETINIYAGSNQNAELSNFAIRPFTTNVETPSGEKQYTFRSVEQGFHFYKALVANNPQIAKQILATTNGGQLKKLTNRSNLKMTPEQVKEWDDTSKSIMLNLMYDSYAQNPKAAEKLLATGNAKITHTQDNTRWRTDFPEVVMTVRDMLREEGFNTQSQITPEQKQQAQQLYSQYLEQNPNGSVEQFKSWIDSNQSNVQYQKLTTEEKAKTIEQVTKEHRSVTALKDLAAKLAHRIGGKVEFVNRTDVDWKGYNQGVTSVLNEVYMTLDTPFHEILGHPIIRAIKNKNIRTTSDGVTDFSQSKLYQSLLKELETGRGKEVFEQVKRDYKYKDGVDFDTTEIKDGEPTSTKEYSEILKYAKEQGFYNEDPFSIGDFTQEKTFTINGKTYKTTIYKEGSSSISFLPKYTLEEQQEEAIVTLLGLMAADKLDTKKDATLISKLKELWKQISDFVKSLLKQDGIKIDELPITTTLNDLAEIMAYGNNKIILPGYKVEYSTPLGNKYDTLEEVNQEIRGLADANVEVDLSEVKLKLDEIPERFESPKEGDFEGWRVWKDKDNQWWEWIEGEQPEIITKERALELWKQLSEFEVFGVKNKLTTEKSLHDFVHKNKEYEQSKEIIEQWKKENNIQYDPEEVYSRGQGFYSSIGAYSNLELDLLLKNLIQHIEDNKKAGGEFTISAFTKPIDKRLKHIEGTGDRVRFVIYPKSEHIKWAAPTDVYSGSVWDAHEKVSKDKKSELLGVSFTKSPALRNINEVSPNLADIIDNLSHVHNELGIELTTNNFRIEYDDNIDYSTKKLIDNVNKILDDKYGKLEKPEITTSRSLTYWVGEQEPVTGEYYKLKTFNSIEEAQNYTNQLSEETGLPADYWQINQQQQGKQPTQTRENTTSIESVKNKISGNKILIPDSSSSTGFRDEFGNDVSLTEKEYTSQAEINLKIAVLKEVARKYPRSLITSKVVPINPNTVNNSEIQYSRNNKENLHIDLSFFQKSPSEQEEYLTNMFENLQEEEEVVENVEVEDIIDSIFQGSLSEVIDNMIHHMDLSDNTSEILLKILSKTTAEIEYVSASELTSTDTIMEYDHGRNVIKVSLERLNEYSPAEISITLLHEMVHSITVESLRNPKTFEQKDLVDLIESFINDNKDLSNEWGMSSTFEFVAELYSNPEFRDKVKEASKTKWWSDFINAIRRLLGLPYKRNYNNLVEKVIEFVDNAESSETTFNQIFERKSTEKESKYANLTSYLNIVYEEIQDKVGQVADRIRASQKFKSQEDKKEYLENIEKLIEFLEEHHETGQWLGVLEYTKLFLKTTQQVNNLLEKITPQDIENGDLGALLHRYEEYLAAYDLLEDMKGLLDFANRKSDELSEKELEDVKEIGDFLRSARIVKEGIDSKILHIKKRQLVKFYSNPLYNTQVTTNWRILLSNEYKNLPEEEREKISETEYISQKLNGEYKQDYEADLKSSAERLVYDPLIDISWTARHLYDPFNTNQPIIQILTNFIGEIRQRIVERSREKSFTIDELHKKLIKEKGNRKPSALFKNLYQQDKNGNYFLKGEYDITFYDAYREEYLPILQSIQEIYKLFGNKLSEETTTELNKLRIKKSTWEKKYLKEDKLTPKDEFKTDLSTLSPAERQMLEEFINITKGSHDKTEGRVSLIRNVSFKRGKKRNDIEFFKLPAINKTDIERRIEADAKGIIKDKTEDLFTIRTDDVGYAKEAITAKGRPVAEIPIYFRGNLDPSQQSLDLASMYKMEFWNGEQFKESTQGKYTAHMILDVVGSNDFLKKSRGVPRLLQNAFAKRQPNQKVEGTSTNTYHRIQGLIERNFGGITTYYAGKFLGKDVNKMISNVQAMTGVLGMSFNAAAGVANLFNGFSNLIMEAVGNNIVGRKHLMKAESKYMLALANGEILSDLTNPVKKSFINQLNEYFDVFGGLMPEQQSSLRNNFMRKFASLGMLNWMNDSGEHMLHSILNMAILDSIKVMNKDGKYINKQGEVVSEENAASLLDMFYLDKNGHLAVHEAVGKTKYNLTIDFQEGGKVHIKNLIKKKIFDIYGVYDTNFKNELSKLWGGKLLMTFKNFFLSLFNYRFAGIEYSHLPLEEREDWQKFYSTADQEYIEGIYTTFVHTVVIPIFKGFKIALIKENYNKLTDYQKANLRKALFEFAMTNVLLPAIGLLLAAMDGDDDDKLWFAIYINRRLTAELAQFRNPVEATKLLTNPIASAKFVRDAIGLSLEIIRPWRWDERAGDGELRIRKRFKRVVPIWNQLEKNYRQLYNIQFNH